MNSNQFITGQLLAAISNEAAFSETTHKAREDALVLLPEMLREHPIDFDQDAMEKIFTAYFLCTYCHTPRKHEIKHAINKMLRENMLENGVKDAEHTLRETRQKPRVVVITNYFNSTHVMFRVYAKSLIALKAQFEVINVCLNKTDFDAAQCFHRVIQVNLPPIHYLDTIRQLRKLIVDLTPDAILYADIAMHPFGVFLSNLRLAPLQCVVAGHPAPSCSPQIDHFITENSYVFNHLPGDDMAFFPEDDFSMAEPYTGPLNLPKLSEGKDALNIIIPTSLHKVTYPFLESLRTIQKETGANIHTTSNITKGGTTLKELLNVTIPGITFYPAMHYDEYMKLVATMDMFLMPYPFNGFSTILDCFTQGVPGIVMDQIGMEGHQGVNMVRRTTKNGAIVVATEKGYIGEAIQLARATDERDFRSYALDDTFGTELWKGKSLFSSRSPGVANTLKMLLDRASR